MGVGGAAVATGTGFFGADASAFMNVPFGGVGAACAGLAAELVFAVILEKPFSSKAKARETVHELPPDIAAQAMILDQWDAGTVFYGQG